MSTLMNGVNVSTRTPIQITDCPANMPIIIKAAPHSFIVFKDLAGEMIGIIGKAPAFKVENDCVSIEVGAIMELDAFAQLAFPHARILIGSAFC